jgi:adenylate kinase
MPRVIIVIGLAGSGKSTQSKLLADSTGYTWLSVGELLRKSASGNTKSEMLAGKLLSVDHVTSVLSPYISGANSPQEIILDGYPRGIDQAKWVLEQTNQGNIDIEAVIHLLANQLVVKERLLERGRQDDIDSAIKERFSEYEDTIRPIIVSFKKAGLNIIEVNAEKSVELVHQSIVEKLIMSGVVSA